MQSEEWITANIAGASQIIDWFEYWPAFHDAEILEINLARKGTSRLKLLTWRMSGDLDERGYHILHKHAVITLLLQDVQDLMLEGFSHQNVIFGLEFEPVANGIKIILEGCFGVEGWLVAKQISAELSVGKPQESC